MDEQKLVQMALEARSKAYAPYSNCKVGAALLAKSGKVYCGCNIENAAYSPTICAERCAFAKAVSEGERGFEAIAVVGGIDEQAESYFPPCGVCRQVMKEFCRDDFIIILYNKELGVCKYTLSELLPAGFEKDNLH